MIKILKGSRQTKKKKMYVCDCIIMIKVLLQIMLFFFKTKKRYLKTKNCAEKSIPYLSLV